MKVALNIYKLHHKIGGFGLVNIFQPYHFLLKYLYKGEKVDCHVCVCVRAVGAIMCVCVRGVDFASVSRNFWVKFGTVPKVWYFFVFHYFGILAFGERELCVLVLHSAWPYIYLTLLWLVHWTLENERCVLVLHSTGPDSYLTLLWLVPWRLKDGSYVYLYYILLDQAVT
jgi:predicted AlkP superfamily pyrophosphatase or phosphodiesterase